jgi:hypothetical protein
MDVPHTSPMNFVVSAVIASVRETALPSATFERGPQREPSPAVASDRAARKFGVNACQNNRGEEP